MNWLGIDEIEKYIENRKRIRIENLEYEIIQESEQYRTQQSKYN